MKVFGADIIIGEFIASHHGCMLFSFDSDHGINEEDTNISVETQEEFIADNPVPVYVGQHYASKLHPEVVLTKLICSSDETDFFTEYECRAILRLITGQRGYQWMKIVTDDPGEDIWYRSRTTSVSYVKLGGDVLGIKLNMECDSQFAWSQEIITNISAKANQPFYIFSNSDDLHNYILPNVDIIPSSSGSLEVRNTEDNNWLVKLDDIIARETIRYDCKNEIIDGSRNDSGQAIINYLDNSNIHFFRILPGKNSFISNIDAQFTFRFREPRKVAFVTT